MKKLFEHTASCWVRYSGYEWKTDCNGVLFLTPEANARLEIYNPIQCAEKLVLNAMDIGLMIFKRTPQRQIQDAILTFAGQYGLLGLMAALPTTPQFVEYEKVYLLKNQFIREEALDTQEYISCFYPFSKPGFYKHGIESMWQENDKTMMALIMSFPTEPQAEVMSFMRNYAERYDWLVKVFRDWAFTFMSSFLYYNDKDTMDKGSLDLYKKGMAAFEGNAPSYHIELREVPTLVWDFHSLMLGIKMLFSLALTDEKQPLRMCRNCQRAFLAKRSTAEFCSARCKRKYEQEHLK